MPDKLSGPLLGLGLALSFVLVSQVNAQYVFEDEYYVRNKPALEYVGFYCARLQTDAIVNPANEITIKITVDPENGSRRSFKFPDSFAYYDNVRKDFMISEFGNEVWRGEPQSMSIHVVMTEHDGAEDLVPSGTETMGSYTMDITNDPGAGRLVGGRNSLCQGEPTIIFAKVK